MDFISIVQKLKRKQLTVKAEHSSLMDRVEEECKRKNISLSTHLCRLAIKDYTSKSVESPSKVSSLPPIDKILEHMLKIKMDLANEVLRLHTRNELSDKEVIEIYLGNRAFQIQLEKTKLIQRLVQITSEKDMIYSKRQSLSPIAIEISTGILIDRFKVAKKQLEKEKERRTKIEEERRKIEEERRKKEIWKRENPGRALKYMKISPDKWAEEEQKDKEYEDLEEIPQEELKEN